MRHNEELHNLHILPDIRIMKSRRLKWEQSANKVKPEGNRPLGRPKHRWEDNIKVDLKDMECEGMDWIHLTQDRD
jgi:hypothetical protein